MAKKSNQNPPIVRDIPPATLMDHLFYGLRLDEDQRAFRDAIWNPEKLVILCNARAGTGKTTIALATANLLVQYGLYDEIIYIVGPHAEAKQGFLPGTIVEKSMYYYQPIYQAAVKLNINPQTAFSGDSMLTQKNGTAYITCSTDSFIRGSTISKAVIIADECQNMTAAQLKTLLTRVSDDSKAIIVGHTEQCDLKVPSDSGFARCIGHFSDREWAQVCSLTKNYRGVISAWADEL